MKRLFLFSAALAFTFAAQAQKLEIGANIMTASPMGDHTFGSSDEAEGIETFTGTPGLGVGGGVEVNYWFNNNISAGLEVGFLSYSGKETTPDGFLGLLTLTSTATAVPIMVKGQYYFLENNIRPFAGVGVGYTIYSPMHNGKVAFENEDSDISYDQNGLVISPRVGVLWQLTDLIGLALNVQYNLMLNEIDGTTDVTIKSNTGDGTEVDTIESFKADPTNYLGVNLGIMFSLFN